jgi:penicillin-binding protein 2
MHKYQPIQTRSEEKRITTQRAIVGLVFIALFILALIGRCALLQIANHEKYSTLSDRNQLRLVPIAPSRGLVYDRKGRLLARNIPAFHLSLVPEKVPNVTKTLDELNDIITLDPQQREALLDRISHSPSHQRQMIKLKLSEEEVSRFAVNQFRFPGVTLNVDLIRDYPYGPLLAHVLGYVSEANRDDLSKMDKKRYAGTYQLGKTGLEKFYENTLQGQPGYHQMETDVLGREIRPVATYPATPGSDLQLTLDVDLQMIATQALGENRGAIVALDPTNGEILALVSLPSYDPNTFVRGLNQSDYTHLMQASGRPLFNRTLQGLYPPASTIKPIVGMAGLVTNLIDSQTRIFDPGWFKLKNSTRQYRDWKEKGHGWTDLEASLRESCDIFYYTLAEKLTIHQLSHWLSQAGLGKATGIDLPGEQAGLVPTVAWKKKVYGTSWYPGETVIAGIGQGYILATPLQLAIMGSYLANRGEAFRPHLNQTLTPEKLPSLPVNHKRYWPLIINPLHQVVQHPRGTAYRYFTNLNFEAAGKTGTAQVFGLKANEKYDHDVVAHHLRDHSLFIGFAPKDDPKIVVAVVLENQRASALIARQVLEAYLTGTPHAKPNDIPLNS